MSRSSTSPTTVAVIGCGAFGRNHARVYHELEQKGEMVKLVGVVDADIARAETVAAQTNSKAYPNIPELHAQRGAGDVGSRADRGPSRRCA